MTIYEYLIFIHKQNFELLNKNVTLSCIFKPKIENYYFLISLHGKIFSFSQFIESGYYVFFKFSLNFFCKDTKIMKDALSTWLILIREFVIHFYKRRTNFVEE